MMGSVPSTSNCSSLAAPQVPGAVITSFVASEIHGISKTFPGSSFDDAITVRDLRVCDITVTLTHPGVNDEVNFQLWLPLTKWNGRFQAVGGGGFAAGAAKRDWAMQPPMDSPWVDLGVFADFSSLALHELTFLGKATAASFYGQPPHHSYWAGCSTGGRQGYVMAQRYPDDFDGIAAHAPAVRWPSVVTSLQWPQVVMDTYQKWPSSCEFQYLLEETISACDKLDGITDGIVSNPFNCAFDPQTIVGQTVECSGRKIAISKETAEIFQHIYDGPTSPAGTSLEPGLTWGTTPLYLASTLNLGAISTGIDFPLAASWFQFFLEKNPSFNLSSITADEFPDYLAQAWAEYGGLIGTSNPDLGPFRDSGGKLLTWHGLADGLLTAKNTLVYRDQVERVMGGADQINKFYRLFLAPGVDHCAGGNGPLPTKTLDALIAWVEEGKAPDVLHGQIKNPSGTTVTGDICLYPLVARYKGSGDPNNASSYSCQASFK
ncbi:tannase and feruloyl esterase-domain-containing protein [Aspergillus pseudodeflectus]|uniref:Carboxylic ester hydrolase n=1 Tax=Aspergillus pseudodeflectus TaxID=176178 RepID=A0ABR4JBW6_9EURO